MKLSIGKSFHPDMVMTNNFRSGSRNAILTISAAALALFLIVSAAQAQPETQENLGPNINTEYAELVPIVSPDGKTLYFDRKNAPENTGGPADPDDIYYSTLKADGTWGPAVNIGPPLNTPGSDVLFWLSPDGNTALVYHGKQVNGQDMGLAITRKVKGKWTEPKKIEIEGLESLGNYYYAHMSADGKRLLLSYAPAPERDSYNFDIFYSPALSNDYMRWGTPTPLTGMINTPFSEGAPFIAADNRTLYFISDRPENYGLSDIYVVRRTGDSWLKWTPPQNLGEFINTPMYEAGISIPASGDWLYTSRTEYKAQGGYGKTDIYRQKLPEDLRPQVGFLLSGQLIDQDSKEGVSGLVRVTDMDGGREISVTTSSSDGRFSAVLLPGIRYKVEGSAAGYATNAQTLDFRTRMAEPVESMTISLAATGTSESPVVQFATGSAQISSANREKLRRLYKSFSSMIGRNRIERIDIIGHTDSAGTDEDNMSLSERRAEAARDALVRLGVPSSLISTSGKGESSPIATNETAQGRALNRRVEINVQYNAQAEPDRPLPSMIPPRQ